ncbi:MAG: ABC transporter ATP-binding protein [Candidatus Bathyarchaeia archaeon]
MIETFDLTRYYGRKLAVENLNITVERGEVFGFIGPNGAGKTTTIRMLSCLIQPTRGTARVGGHDILEEPMEVKRVVGLVPENPPLYDRLTGREYLEFVGRLHRVPEGERGRRMDELLEAFRLGDVANQLIVSYSRGMKQKLAFSAALIHSPKVLLLDEPTAGVDVRSAKIMKDIIKGLSEEGATVFYSTHIMELAERICQRVGIINEGRLIAVGTLDELKSRFYGTDLEDVLLKLTGGAEEQEIIEFLKSEEEITR